MAESRAALIDDVADTQRRVARKATAALTADIVLDAGGEISDGSAPESDGYEYHFDVRF